MKRCAVNLNTLAEKVTKAEGKRVSLSIAQVKEVLKITLFFLANDYPMSEVIALLERSEFSVEI